MTSDSHVIAITTSSFGEVGSQPLEMLKASGAEYRLNPYGRKPNPDELIALIADADGLIAGTETLDRSVLLQTPKLRIISRCGTGLDNIDLNAAAELGIVVCNTPDAHVDAVAELTLAGMLDVLRRVSYADRLIRQGEWQKPMGGLLCGKMVGIIGLGRVGKALVKLLQPFNVTVLATDPHRDDDFARRYGVRYCPLDDLLSQADLVTLHLPYSKDVHHMLDRARLSALKSSAILINTARGGLVDEAALYDLIKQKKIAGAYVDTFEQEPYRGPLTELSNVVLTAHIGSYAAESRARMEAESVENLLRFFRENTKKESAV